MCIRDRTHLGPGELIETIPVVAMGGTFLVKFCEGVPEKECWQQIVSTNPIDFFEGVMISPNPAADFLDIEVLLSKAQTLTVSINTLFGQTLIENTYSDINIRDRISLTQLQSGVYLITLSIDGRPVKNQKVLKL